MAWQTDITLMLRHMLNDFGYLSGLKAARVSAAITLIIAVLLSIALGVQLW